MTSKERCKVPVEDAIWYMEHVAGTTRKEAIELIGEVIEEMKE